MKYLYLFWNILFTLTICIRMTDKDNIKPKAEHEKVIVYLWLSSLSVIIFIDLWECRCFVTGNGIYNANKNISFLIRDSVLISIQNILPVF